MIKIEKEKFEEILKEAERESIEELEKQMEESAKEKGKEWNAMNTFGFNLQNMLAINTFMEKIKEKIKEV